MLECIPYYEPGGRITAHADVALTGKRFVAISATKQPGATLTTSGVDQTSGGNIRVGNPAAGARTLGVASHDAPVGSKVTVISTPGTVVPVTTVAALLANVEVETDAAGRAVALGAGRARGVTLADAPAGGDAMVKLY
jgi:hypothetical protein